MRSLFFLLAAALPLATGSNHSDDDNTLDAGAITGIVLGTIVGVALILFLVLWTTGMLPTWFPKRPTWLKRPSFGMGMGMGKGAAATDASSSLGGNNLPMVALRVNGDDDDL